MLIWILSAAAFTGVVFLAISTAAIDAENVRLRRQIQRSFDELIALEVTLEAERVEWAEVTRLENLAACWERFEARSRE